MKVKIELEDSDTLGYVEEELQKALNTKKECSDSEKYIDPVLNEFHDKICIQHNDLIKSILKEIKVEIIRHVNSQELN